MIPVVTLTPSGAQGGAYAYREGGRVGIVLGEAGRGRVRTFVPLPDDALLSRWGEEDVRVGDASRIADLWGWMVTRVPAPRGARDAVVLLVVRTFAGYRGHWTFRPWAERFCPREEAPLRIYEGCPDCGGHGRHQLAPGGLVSAQDIGLVLAEGYCAQGEAGRMGGGAEYIIAARPGRFGIARSGRTYGQPDVLNISISPAGEVEMLDAVVYLRAAQVEGVW